MQQNVSLKDYTTMHLGGSARVLATASSNEQMIELIKQADSQNFPILILGDGSNLIVGDKGFAGLVILNRIPGYEVLSEDNASALIKIGGGENWDEVVQRTTDAGLSGIEALSAIPGRAGASPIQNIGAYGQEIADTLISLEAYDLMTKEIVTLSNEDCDFSYRRSIFNTAAKKRYVVLNITLQLSKSQLQPPFYNNLEKYLESNKISDYSPASIRRSVTALRATKLPDPFVIANTGSFFRNPFIEKWEAENLRRDYDNPPIFEMGDNVFKVSAGWLIEEADLKGFELGGMKVYDKNALVLVNQNATHYQELADIREYIVDAVRDKFRINLVQEPEEIGV